nr:GIY-YIG nuclease family protein [Desulfobulbaceae bacterium]
MTDGLWFVYIVRCSDNSLYTGIAKDLERRVFEHNSEAGGSRYTRARKPVEMVYFEAGISRSAVCKRENQIKKMTVQQKNSLINTADTNKKPLLT